MKNILAVGWQANSLGFSGENIPAVFAEAMANGYYEIPEDNYKVLLENSKSLNSESLERYFIPNVIVSCSFKVKEFLNYNFLADISVILTEYTFNGGEIMFCPAHADTVEIHVSKKDGSEEFSFYGLLDFNSSNLEDKVERKIFEEVRSYLNDEKNRIKEDKKREENEKTE